MYVCIRYVCMYVCMYGWMYYVCMYVCMHAHKKLRLARLRAGGPAETSARLGQRLGPEMAKRLQQVTLRAAGPTLSQQAWARNAPKYVADEATNRQPNTKHSGQTSKATAQYHCCEVLIGLRGAAFDERLHRVVPSPPAFDSNTGRQSLATLLWRPR